MSKPLAVVISDIHFNINTLPVATAALTQAIKTAEEMKIPLIIAGDLHDTKAIIRAEVANRLLELFKDVSQPVAILVGNHDLLNEKGTEHGLNYLSSPNVTIIDTPRSWNGVNFIPYMSSKEAFLEQTKRYQGLIICHQGFLGAAMGDYVQDKSSVDPTLLKEYTIISGHYHRHQTLGPVTYIGSPYTMTYGEANDGPKGFLILHEDGTFKRKYTGLRRHIIINCTWEEVLKLNTDKSPYLGVNSNDLLWLKVRGPESELRKLKKLDIGKTILGHANFKLELLPESSSELVDNITNGNNAKLTPIELLNTIIDESKETPEQIKYLKGLLNEIAIN